MKTQPFDTSQTSPGTGLLSPTMALNRFANLPQIVTSESRDDPAATSVRYGFRLANLGLLIAPQTHSEVLEPLAIFPLPNTPSWFLGLCNLRGNIVPVYDLEGVFKMQGDDQEKRYLMVLGKAEQSVGLLIRGLPQPQMLDMDQVMANQPPLPERLREFAANAYMIDQQVWVEFDHKAFFQSLVEQYSA